EKALAHGPGPVGVDDDEALALGERIHARIALLLARVGARAVEMEHDRGMRRRFPRNVQDIVALESADPEMDIVIAGLERQRQSAEREAGRGNQATEQVLQRVP